MQVGVAVGSAAIANEPADQQPKRLAAYNLGHPVLLRCVLLQVHKGDVLQGLQRNAVGFELGKEPWRRFAADAAAAAGIIGDSSSSSSSAAAASALEGRLLYVADQLFADSNAALANAVKAAMSEFWREYRLVRAVAVARQDSTTLQAT
jgi:hypothetical protein